MSLFRQLTLEKVYRVLQLKTDRLDVLLTVNSDTRICYNLTIFRICLVVLGFNATLTAKVISWRSVKHVFPGFLTPVLTQVFFPKPPTTFLTCFCRGERRKYAGKKSRLNRRWNSQPHGHESDTLTTQPPNNVQKHGNEFCYTHPTQFQIEKQT